MSNAVKMSLEEKLVQQIKETTLGSLMDDEDAIVTLTKRAITEALFTERTETTGSGYNQTTKKVPSAVQQAANDVAQIVVTSFMMEMMVDVLKDEDTMKKIKEATAALFPGIILRNMDQQALAIQRAVQTAALQSLANSFMAVQDQQSASAAAQASQNVFNMMPQL